MKAITFFDVETPNVRNDKICSIGVVRTDRQGRIEHKNNYLVNPECGFDSRNVDINGVHPSMIAGESTFVDLWESELADLFAESLVIGHNTLFDLNVLAKTLAFYDVGISQVFYDCTLHLTRHYYPDFDDYTLSAVCRSLSLPSFRHHDSLEDAEACKNLFFALEETHGVLEYSGKLFDSGQITFSRDTRAYEKAMTDLYGITIGVLLDGIVRSEELSAYARWIEEQAEYRKLPLFNEAIPVVQHAIADGVLTCDERETILNLARPFSTSVDGSSTTATQELLGVLKGIGADRVLYTKEARNLKHWMDDHRDLLGSKAFPRLYAFLEEALIDGAIDKLEESRFFELVDSIIHPTETDSNKSLEFQGKKFCLSGDFVRGTKKDIKEHIEELGGECIENVTKRCDYVVVGGLGSKAYAYGQYGTKVMKAMRYQDDGLPIQIIQEESLFIA